MGQTGKRNYTDAVPPSRFAKSERSVRRARYKKRKKALALIACILVLAFIAIFALEPASASTKTLLQSFRRAEEAQSAPVEEQVSEGIIHIQPAEDALTGGSADFALRDAGALSIVSWQGAKNCGESFDVTLNGVEEGQFVQFVANNCTVFPQTGSTDDVYTVTVTGAGSYSLTAMTDDTAAAHDTRNGVAGKADQLPLSVSGWGGAQDYYDSFRISVSGGNTGGAITFQTDGCTVSPETGNANTVFDVTVTRVGSYELTAIMDGDRNFNPAYSAKMSGCSSKSAQSPIHIEDWQETACCNETFRVKIYGGTTSEVLSIDTIGCTVEKIASDEYEVCVNTVGPYAITAYRAGNYGYFSESASVSGISRKASAPLLSVSGWSESRSCNDSFPIRISGGVNGASISFQADGCTVSPATGTTETNYTVTVTSAGDYSLSAVMDGTENYESANTRTYRGQSCKGTQSALRVENWIDCAPAGSSFEIIITGGSGTGAVSVTTDEGCTARLKSGETNVYIVSVYPQANTGYSVTAGKASDASFEPAKELTAAGTTSGANQAALIVSGWSESVYSGDSFDIALSGGNGTGAVSFETSGCKITAADAAKPGTYTVTVTAREHEKYSLKVSREGDENYLETSVQHAGSVKPFESTASQTLLEPVSNSTYAWVYICGGIVVLFAVVLLMLQFRSGGRRRRHYR
jgi:hypothetical protein